MLPISLKIRGMLADGDAEKAAVVATKSGKLHDVIADLEVSSDTDLSPSRAKTYGRALRRFKSVLQIGTLAVPS